MTLVHCTTDLFGQIRVNSDLVGCVVEDLALGFSQDSLSNKLGARLRFLKAVLL
jgi:hypothetical protein